MLTVAYRAYFDSLYILYMYVAYIMNRILAFAIAIILNPHL